MTGRLAEVYRDFPQPKGTSQARFQLIITSTIDGRNVCDTRTMRFRLKPAVELVESS